MEGRPCPREIPRLKYCYLRVICPYIITWPVLTDTKQKPVFLLCGEWEVERGHMSSAGWGEGWIILLNLILISKEKLGK